MIKYNDLTKLGFNCYYHDGVFQKKLYYNDFFSVEITYSDKSKLFDVSFFEINWKIVSKKTDKYFIVLGFKVFITEDVWEYTTYPRASFSMNFKSLDILKEFLKLNQLTDVQPKRRG